ncbi:MAG: thioredoxin family protein [Methanomethylovorans sp.]|uniref:thioredoxin family protein n=1 Tax=Methanomethylovorans sp. TaxID=2758717 RepID=UPI000A94E46B|nr:thioredoxin family protein [Methanomethylovorans sp.]
MNKYHFLYIVAFLISVSGCIDGGTEPSGNSTVVNVQDLLQIDEALISGPVLVDIGFDACPACKIMKPTIEEISQEYAGKATVMYIDTRKNPEVAMVFDVYSVPDMFVIVGNGPEGYLYMTHDGDIVKDRNIARFIGVTGKDILTKTLDMAIVSRQNK